MLTDVMEEFGLSRGFRRYGFKAAFETNQTKKMGRELTNIIKNGNLVVVSGIMGIGKTTTMRVIKDNLNREREIIICRSLSLEKQKVNLVTLMTAIFNDLMIEKSFKIPSQPEKRERILCELIGKKQKPVALFVDEAHDLNGKTLTGLKRMIETVQENSKGILSIVLIGHPRLKNSMRRSYMEEVGARTEILELEGMNIEERKSYVRWLIKECRRKNLKKTNDLIDPDAIDTLIKKVYTPLQIEQNLELAFFEAYKIGQKPINVEVIESVIARDIDDIEAKLARLGYNTQSVAEVLNIKRTEAKHFMAGKLSPSKSDELCNGLMIAGIPI